MFFNKLNLSHTKLYFEFNKLLLYSKLRSLVIVSVLIRVMLHRVDEIREHLFLLDLNRSEMLADELGELRFIHPGPGRDLVELFVPPQGLHLKTAEVNLWILAVRVGGIVRVAHGPLAL